jgi:CTP:molybdopterin cytidylyltransferase MocA
LEQIDRIATSTLTEVYIGLGFDYQVYLNEIPWFTEAQSHFVLYKNVNVRIIINQKPELGSFSTLQIVLQQVPKNRSVLINPIDIPILNTTELQSIIETRNLIVLPNFEGKNGHPIKLYSDFWKPLLLLNPTDENSRLDLEIKKIDPSKTTTITVTDSFVVKNLNTPKDWTEFLKA